MADKKKPGFINLILFWVIIIFLTFTVVMVAVDMFDCYRYFNDRIKKTRTNYISEQRRIIKQSVNHVVSIINNEGLRIEQVVSSTIKSRVNEAYSIAWNIFDQYKGKLPESEIQKIILTALKPIRYKDGIGYYFITGMDGVEILFADKPEMEGKNLLDVKDVRGKYIVRDMIDIVRKHKEGFYEYYWTKPGMAGSRFKKISYVKLFEPFGWFIGTGLYTDDVESDMHRFITDFVSDYRFGPSLSGYVFILKLIDIHGGDDFAIMYANPNRPDLIGKYLSDSLKDAKGKEFRKEFLRKLRENGEGYVDYWYKKFDNPDPSPKTSFFKLTNDGSYIVAAGVYLDDIESEIALMHKELRSQLKTRLLHFLTVALGVVVLFILFLKSLRWKLRQDFKLFVSFLNRAAGNDEKIELENIKFAEFETLAKRANKMLEDKIQAQKALRDEKEQLYVTIKSIGEGVITTDITGRIELMNSVAEDLTGWAASEAAGRELSEVFKIFDENTRNTSVNPVNRVLEEKVQTDSTDNAVMVSRTGDEYQIAHSAAPILDIHGNILGVVLVFRDVTEKIKTENELFKIKKLESVGLLAGGIAHDFNNILAGVFGNIELARMTCPAETGSAQYLDRAVEALERATHLTNQLLTFSKGGDPVIEAVDLKTIIETTVRFNLTGSNIKAQFSIPDDLWQVKADKGQINQVISNLIINSKQAMTGSGTIRIEAENVESMNRLPNSSLRGRYVRMSIKDEGKGIPGEDLERIFDPFFTTKHMGNGLGLATVHSIIKKHKGFINVESTVGFGSVFTVYLPAEDCSNTINPAEGDESVKKPKRPEHALIMDDERIVLEVGGEMLEKVYGCRVEFARNGSEALSMYERAFKEGDPFDIVIMDLTIPGGPGGKETVGRLLQINPDAKIIVSSGYSKDPVMSDYSASGFCGKLAKPFQIKNLMDAVSECME